MTVAYNGEQAISEIEKSLKKNSSHFDYIFMDINMPIMDGNQACTEIRKRIKIGEFYQVKILAVTAYDNAENIKHIMISGFDAYLPKPINKEMVLEVMK